MEVDMTDDIVRRLRAPNDYTAFTAVDGWRAIRMLTEAERRSEAADEIERLRQECERPRFVTSVQKENRRQLLEEMTDARFRIDSRNPIEPTGPQP